MSKPLKYSDFAKAIQVARASITMAVKNRSLIPVDGKKEIDPDHPANRAWILKQEARGKLFDINLIYEASTPREIPAQQTDIDSLQQPQRKTITLDDIRKIEIKQKLANFKKTEKDIILSELKIKKIEGELIPFEAASSVFMYAIESYRATFLQGVKKISNIFSQRLGADHKQYVAIQQELSEAVKEITEEAKENVMGGLDGVVAEYMEIRGRGERK